MLIPGVELLSQTSPLFSQRVEPIGTFESLFDAFAHTHTYARSAGQTAETQTRNPALSWFLMWDCGWTRRGDKPPTVGMATNTVCLVCTLGLESDKPMKRTFLASCVFRATARDKALLADVGITHVVNAAHGPQHVDTGARFYDDTSIVYRGVGAPDRKDFDLSPFFADTADFIHGALSQRGTSRQIRWTQEKSNGITVMTAVFKQLTNLSVF